jgi:hypothetical protein
MIVMSGFGIAVAVVVGVAGMTVGNTTVVAVGAKVEVGAGASVGSEVLVASVVGTSGSDVAVTLFAISAAKV